MRVFRKEFVVLVLQGFRVWGFGFVGSGATGCG